MTVLLDSSVIIDALRRRMDRRNFLLKLSENGCILACCAINVAEVYAGVKPGEEHDTLKFFQGVGPIKDISVFAGGLPDDEDIDEMLEEIYRLREP